MNDLSTEPQPVVASGQTPAPIEMRDEPKADPRERPIRDHETNEHPPRADDVGAPAADRRPREAMAVPVVKRRRGRGLLLAGVAVVLMGGATAAGVMYHKPLLAEFNKIHAEANEQVPEIPGPVHPATRLNQTGKSSQPLAPRLTAGQTGTGKADQNNQRQAAMPASRTAGTNKSTTSDATHPVAKPPAGSGSALSEIDSLQAGSAGTGMPSEVGVGKGKAAPSPGKKAGQFDAAARQDLSPGDTKTGRAPTSSAQTGIRTGANTRMPANTMMTITHPVQAALNLQKEMADGNAPSFIYVMSLAGKLGIVVAQQRTETAHLAAEVASLRQDLKNQLASFDRRLTYEQAKARLALAGTAQPHLSAADAPPVGIFPQHRLPHAQPVSPSSYRVQAASPGVAILSRDGEAYEVSAGNIVPGVGRVLSIQQDGSEWVVQTTHGAIR